MDLVRAVVVPQLVNLNVASRLLLVLVTGLFTLINVNVLTSNLPAVTLAVPQLPAVLQSRNAVHLQKLAVQNQHAVHQKLPAAQNQHVVHLKKHAAQSLPAVLL